jgi:hypothetical protein
LYIGETQARSDDGITLTGKGEILEINFFQWHFIHHKSHEPLPPRRKHKHTLIVSTVYILYLHIFTVICRGIPGGAEIFWHLFQTGPGAHPASYTMVTGSFLGVKRSGRGVDHPPQSSVEVKERVHLYCYSTSGPSWPVRGWNLPLPLPLCREIANMSKNCVNSAYFL